MSTINRLAAAAIVPIVTIDDALHAHRLASTLVEATLPCMEITLRTPDAIESIAIASGVPGAVVGAGTVCTVTDVERCADAGAAFIVSPGFDPAVVERAQELNLLAIPGIATATELQRAISSGLTTVKLFPVAPLGGLALVKALSAPFPDISFFPSGGVTESDFTRYLSLNEVVAVGGSWMVPRREITAGRTVLIRDLAAAAAHSRDAALATAETS